MRLNFRRTAKVCLDRQPPADKLALLILHAYVANQAKLAQYAHSQAVTVSADIEMPPERSLAYFPPIGFRPQIDP